LEFLEYKPADGRGTGRGGREREREREREGRKFRRIRSLVEIYETPV